MAIFPIRTFGDPVLRTPAQPVEEFNRSLSRLADDMLETMYNAPGVGLAAPQIGVSKQVFVFDIGEGANVLVNPVIVEQEGYWEFEEGCLSVPDRSWTFSRPDWVRAEGLDLEGKPVVFEGSELLGRVLQHEIDHLKGVLLIERLDLSVRKDAMRELRREAIGPTL